MTRAMSPLTNDDDIPKTDDDDSADVLSQCEEVSFSQNGSNPDKNGTPVAAYNTAGDNIGNAVGGNLTISGEGVADGEVVRIVLRGAQGVQNERPVTNILVETTGDCGTIFGEFPASSSSPNSEVLEGIQQAYESGGMEVLSDLGVDYSGTVSAYIYHDEQVEGWVLATESAR